MNVRRRGLVQWLRWFAANWSTLLTYWWVACYTDFGTALSYSVITMYWFHRWLVHCCTVSEECLCKMWPSLSVTVLIAFQVSWTWLSGEKQSTDACSVWSAHFCSAWCRCSCMEDLRNFIFDWYILTDIGQQTTLVLIFMCCLYCYLFGRSEMHPATRPPPAGIMAIWEVC